ncbi:MAG: diguanylate cyclase [Trueperaceae bacterium]|nr:MAG: diguanylate cyclase [Trueperaceae bacterium]
MAADHCPRIFKATLDGMDASRDAPPVLPTALQVLCKTLNSPKSLLEQLGHVALAAAALAQSDHAEVILNSTLARRFIGTGSARVHVREPDDETTRWITEKRRALVVPNLDYATSEGDLTLKEQGVASYLGVPIMIEDDAVGALIVFNNGPRSYEGEEQRNLELLADLAATAIAHQQRLNDLMEARRTLLRFSLTDPGTGLASKQQFDYLLKREWKRATSEGLTVSVMQFQIDAFDAFIEQHGVEQARQLMAKAARLLGAVLYRSGDLAARLDDTTFVALLPDTDLGGAKAIAERFRREMATSAPRLNNLPITISVGISTLDALSPQSTVTTPQKLYELASEALEQAKAAGGNRVLSIS